MKVKVIYGCSCSGKSTYVTDRCGDTDVIYDYDKILSAITNRKEHICDKHPAHLHVVSFRSLFTAKISDESGIDTAWIITRWPSDFLKNQLEGCEVEYTKVEATKPECFERLENDSNRPDKEAWRAVIDRWFEEHEPESVSDSHITKIINSKTTGDEGMKINLKGTILSNDDADIMRWFGWLDVICPLDISNTLAEAAGGDVTVYINSPGGDLLAGSEMYGLLKAHEGKTTAVIQSHSASASTVAMMGCDVIRAEPPALICVHNPSGMADGDAKVHMTAARELKTVKEAIINAYMPRAKISREELSALMDKDMWITPQQAYEYGLVDEIIDGGELNGNNNIIVNAVGSLAMPTDEMRRQYMSHKAGIKAKHTQALLELYAKY